MSEDIVRYSEKEINGEVYLVKTREWKEQQDRALYEARFRASGLPLHCRALTVCSYIGASRVIPRRLSKYINQFDDTFCNIHLYFWSHENGTQKTTMASVVGNELLKRGKSVRFILMGELLSLLSDLERKDEAQTRREDLLSCDYLVIDDSFDRRKATIYRSGFQISFLDIFLRERLEVYKRATCFTSNFSIDEIDEEVFGRSLKKLIQRSVPVSFPFDTLYSDRNDFDPNSLWS